jgi:predicted transcriptional regulator
MPKTITLRLDDDRYEIFKRLAEQENRPISNFIETATLRYIQSVEYADEFEMAEIKANKDLNECLQRGIVDARSGRGYFL